MVLYSHATRELTAKVVYYGPGLSGKTTNLQALHDRLDKGATGRLLSLATPQDRTIYFDLLPVELGNIKGNTVRFQLCTVPGQVFYNETRKLVLKGVDGIVFVVDSQWSVLSHDLESYQNLLENLRLGGMAPETIPIVVQYNKRDLPGILSIEALQDALGFREFPFVEAVASEGKGVVETFRLISKMTFVDLIRRLSRRGPQNARLDESPSPRWSAVPLASPPPPPPPFPAPGAPETSTESSETADAAGAAAGEAADAAPTAAARESAETPEGLPGGAEGPITYDFQVDAPPLPRAGEVAVPEPEPVLAIPEATSAPIAEPEVTASAPMTGQEIAPFDEPPPPSGTFTFEPPPPMESGAVSEAQLSPTEETPAPAPDLEGLASPSREEEPLPKADEAAEALPLSPDGRLEELEKRIEALEQALSSLRLALAPLASFTAEAKKEAASGDEPENPGAG